MRFIFLPLIIIALIPSIGLAADQYPYCFEEAAAKYDQVSALMLWSIAKVESGFDPRVINKNKNGTIDFGVMQINEYWAGIHGLSWWNELGHPCKNIKAGAMILADCLQRLGVTAMGIGCYNAISDDKRLIYARKVLKVMSENGSANMMFLLANTGSKDLAQ